MPKNKRQPVLIDLDLKNPHRLVRADVLMVGIVNGLKHCKMPYPALGLQIAKNVRDAIELLPAHSGESFWTKKSDRPKSYGWICNNCFGVAYDMPHADGKCGYEFCPHCGAAMNGEQTE